MTLKQKDMELLVEVVNLIRIKRGGSRCVVRDIAEMIDGLHRLGWLTVRRGELEVLRNFVRRLE